MRRLGVGMAIFSIALMAVSWAVANDAEIAREITRKLKHEKDAGRLQSFDINLQVAEGTVVIKGFVTSKEQQELAMYTARRTAGVKQVVNQLQVQRLSSLGDGEIAGEIARILSEHKAAGRLKDFRISVDVTDGAVTLDGVVTNEVQKRLAREVAASVSGVQGIVDKMSIHPSEREAIPVVVQKPAVTDAEIARQVTTRLKHHQDRGDLQGFEIDMSVQDGIVTYDGHVASEEQIALALKAAYDVDGVRDIVCNLIAQDSAPQAETPVIPKLAPQPIAVAASGPPRTARPSAPSVSSGNRITAPRVENALYQSEAADMAKLDERIGTELMSRLQEAKQQGQLKGFGIGVHVQNAEVRLSGRVSSKEQQQMAIEIARYIPEVKRVVNDLTITELTAAPIAVVSASAQGGTDAESLKIVQQLGARIELQEAMGRLQGCDFDLRVEDSEVLFNGYVASAQQERLLLELAQQVPGVRRVTADLRVTAHPSGSVAMLPATVQMPYGAAAPSLQVPVAYSSGQMAAPMAMVDQTPRPIGAGAAQMAAYAGGAMIAAPMLAMSQWGGGGAPAHLPGPGQAVVPARYDHPNLPGHAWPSYAAYPNYAAVTYPKQYSPTAWPYIGPFYPYPQVPLGWRKVTLKWKDGWWQLNFKSK